MSNVTKLVAKVVKKCGLLISVCCQRNEHFEIINYRFKFN